MNVVGALQRAPDRDALAASNSAIIAVVFDVELLLRAGRIFAFDDVVGLFPDAVDVALFDQICFEDVVLSPDDFGRLFAFFDGENRGKWFVLDGYRSNCLAAESAGRGCASNRIGSSGWLTNSSARQGWSFSISAMQFFPGISLADTITKSFQLIPGPNVIFLIFPRGIWLRTVAPKIMSGKGNVVDVSRLSGNFVAPFFARRRKSDNSIAIHAQLNSEVREDWLACPNGLTFPERVWMDVSRRSFRSGQPIL